jgi:hypothetical protein
MDTNEAAERLLLALGLDPDDQERWEVADDALAAERRATVAAGRSIIDKKPWLSPRALLQAILDETAIR